MLYTLTRLWTRKTFIGINLENLHFDHIHNGLSQRINKCAAITHLIIYIIEIPLDVLEVFSLKYFKQTIEANNIFNLILYS